MAEPFISVVVPTYRRPAKLAACLRALARLDYPRARFEVIVVDDGSAAPPEEAMAALDRDVSACLLAVEHGGPAAARNAGAARAKGELLAFTDDDCMPAPGWLRALAERFGSAGDAMLGGRTVNALSDNPYSTTTQLVVEYVSRQYDPAAGGPEFFASNNLAVPAETFRAVGGFDASFPLAAAEDRELCARWRRGGGRLVYVPEALVLHAHHLTLRRFCRQHFNYGRGRSQLGSRVAWQQASPMSSFAPPAFYLKLLACARRAPQGTCRASITALLALSQVATAAGFLHERWRGTTPR